MTGTCMTECCRLQVASKDRNPVGWNESPTALIGLKVQVHRLWSAHGRRENPWRRGQRTTLPGIVATADNQRVNPELLQSFLDALILFLVFDLADFTREWPASEPASDASMRLTRSAFRVTTSGSSTRLYSPAYPCRNHDRFNTNAYASLCHTLDYCIQPAAIAAACDDPYSFYRCHDTLLSK